MRNNSANSCSAAVIKGLKQILFFLEFHSLIYYRVYKSVQKLLNFGYIFVINADVFVM